METFAKFFQQKQEKNGHNLHACVVIKSQNVPSAHAYWSLLVACLMRVSNTGETIRIKIQSIYLENTSRFLSFPAYITKKGRIFNVTDTLNEKFWAIPILKNQVVHASKTIFSHLKCTVNFLIKKIIKLHCRTLQSCQITDHYCFFLRIRQEKLQKALIDAAKEPVQVNIPK